MQSCVTLLTYLFTITFVHSQQNICVWQRKEKSTTYVNGLYVWNASNNGYFEKIDSYCPPNTLYLYLVTSKWHIGPTIGDNDNYIAICDSTDDISNPSECGSLWTFNGQLDASVTVSQGTCPVLDECKQINVVYWSIEHCNLSPDDCCGQFDMITDNTYYKPTSDGGRYLYFSNTDFRWICSKSISDTLIAGKCHNLSSSLTIDAYSLQPTWIDLKAHFIRKFSWSSNKNKTVYLECASIAPTTTPTEAPTMATLSPTNIPTDNPLTMTPTYNPTTQPTISPTAPTTHDPSGSPTFSPTQSPTRYPIISREYDSFFKITYLIKELEIEFIEILINYIYDMNNDITEIIEQSYFETTGLRYTFFSLKIEKMLGNKIKDIGSDKYSQFASSAHGISLNSKIKCDKVSCTLLSNDDFTDEFENTAETKLRKYFPEYMLNVNAAGGSSLNNSELIFEIASFGKIGVLYPEEPAALFKNFVNDNDLLVALLIMMIITFIISFFAFLHNKEMFFLLPSGILMDDTIWFALMIYGLHVTNLLTDIKICVDVMTLAADDEFTDLRINICAIASVMFLVIPYFGLNLHCIRKITKIIGTYAKENVYAISFFEDTWLVLLFIFCGDCYTVIYLLSSSIFGLNMFNSGLTSCELKKMSKIKIISTIILQNIPQICIQCVYAAVIHDISATIVFAFVTSILSIMVTPFKFKGTNMTYFTYYIEIKSKDENENEIEKFLLHQGKTHKMSMIIGQAFGYEIHETNIEISRKSMVNSSDNGIVLYVIHKSNKITRNILEIIKLYQKKQNFLQSKFKRHFDLNGECIILFKIANGQDDAVDTDNFEELLKKTMNERGLNYNAKADKQKFVNYLYGNEITGYDGGERQKYNKAGLNTIELQSSDYDNNRNSDE